MKKCLKYLLIAILILGFKSGAYISSSFAGEMILIPAGEFIMGSNPVDDGRRGFGHGVDEEPRHKVKLDAFYIDQYEVTIEEYREFLDATGREWYGDAEDESRYSSLPVERDFNIPDSGRHPVNYIAWNDAYDFCRWKGKRLPTEFEWEKAARGTDGRKWPWGNEFDKTKANVEENSLRRTAAIGNYPEDKSPFGLYDVSGNVSEWTSSHYLPYPGNTFDDGMYSKNVYVLKGGSFLLPGRLYGRPAARSLAFPAYNHRMYGIRCAKDAN